jgi:16S rRNA (cytosine1402-N4)-methyltransferase
MLDEVIEYLNIKPGGRYVDATLGEGGHTEHILAASSPDGEVLGIDRDQEALDSARGYLAAPVERLHTVHAPFGDLLELLAARGWGDGVDGVLVDLGISTLQLRRSQRGFSFAADGPLDMRMDADLPRSAADLVNELAEEELANIIYRFGEERASRRIARTIVHTRGEHPLATTSDLREAVIAAGVRGKPGRDPATRTFQALRIAVNDELGQVTRLMEDGWKALRSGGRMVILSYHSLEDRIVKNEFRRWAANCLCPPRQPICNCGWHAKVKLVKTRKLKPTDEEVSRNPRARSAGLRVVERIESDDSEVAG